MKRLLLSFSIGLVALLSFNSCSESKKAEDDANNENIDIIAYYAGNSTTFKKYQTEQLTHIIYSFLFFKRKSNGIR